MRFLDGDDAGFLACFADSVCVYPEPELSAQPLLTSSAQLAAWVERVRTSLSSVEVDLDGLLESGSGCVTDAIIVADARMPDVWRLSLAACVDGDAITQVRAFRDRGAARDWLLGTG